MRDRRIHPDDFARAVWRQSSPVACEGIRYHTDVQEFALECSKEGCGSIDYRWSYSVGKAGNKRKRPVPIPVCAADGCNTPWEVTERSMPRSVEDKATKRPWRFDLQMERVIRAGVLKRLADTFVRSRTDRWEARLYMVYIEHFLDWRGGGGLRALTQWAAGKWSRAPFVWSKSTVHRKVRRGRELWAQRLAKAAYIDPPELDGSWWWQHGDEREFLEMVERQPHRDGRGKKWGRNVNSR